MHFFLKFSKITLGTLCKVKKMWRFFIFINSKDRENWRILSTSLHSYSARRNQSVIFNNGQRMVLRTFYLINVHKSLLWKYYYIRCSQSHLLATFENKRLVSPLIKTLIEYFSAIIIIKDINFLPCTIFEWLEIIGIAFTTSKLKRLR